jgi:uncharacterized membrane protein YjjP (DUF1212 family)
MQNQPMDDVEDTRTTRRIRQVESIAKQHFDCLLDSGANAAKVKEVAQHFKQAIQAALVDAVISLLKQLKEKQDETT